jgi:MmyB-like transcription regulator ligand binding domain
MLAAGYAPVWHERDLSAPDLAVVNAALDYMLTQHEVALHFIRGVEADAHADGAPKTADLLERLLAFPDVSALSELTTPEEGQSPVLPIDFQREGSSLRLFTTIATLGPPRDVTVEEIRIEFYFPMDEPTEQAFRSWAK